MQDQIYWENAVAGPGAGHGLLSPPPLSPAEFSPRLRCLSELKDDGENVQGWENVGRGVWGDRATVIGRFLHCSFLEREVTTRPSG